MPRSTSGADRVLKEHFARIPERQRGYVDEAQKDRLIDNVPERLVHPNSHQLPFAVGLGFALTICWPQQLGVPRLSRL